MNKDACDIIIIFIFKIIAHVSMIIKQLWYTIATVTIVVFYFPCKLIYYHKSACYGVIFDFFARTQNCCGIVTDEEYINQKRNNNEKNYYSRQRGVTIFK